MKKVFYLLFMSITIFSCDQEESIQDNESLATLNDTKNVIFSDFDENQYFNLIGLGKGDILRAWSWDGINYSYITFENGESRLHIGTLNGSNPRNNLPTHSRHWGFGDDMRGWSWDGHLASYISFAKNENTLYVRRFDPGTRTFARNYERIKLKKIISSKDNIRGWSWDGYLASYILYEDGVNTLYTRPFDGKKFGSIRSSEVLDISILGVIGDGDNIRSFSYNVDSFSRPSYHIFDASSVVDKDETTLVIEPFR